MQDGEKDGSTSRLGRRLAQLRRLKGLTQDQLAERLSVERETVSRFERGVTDPAFSKLLEICDVLNVPAAALLTDASSNLQDHSQRIEQALRACAPEDRELLCELFERLARRLSPPPGGNP